MKHIVMLYKTINVCNAMSKSKRTNEINNISVTGKGLTLIQMV